MRKSETMRRSAKMLGFAVAALLPLKMEASILTWDAGTAGGNGSHPATPQDGLGTWSTSSLNWSSGASDAGWTNTTANSAVIGSNNNVVSGVQNITTGGALTLGNITFGAVNGGSYDVVGTSGNTLGMTGSTPTVTVNNGVTAEIDAAIAVTGSQPNLTVNGAGTLNLNPTVEGSNYHGVIVGGTANVVLVSAGAASIAIPNNSTAVNFDGGTLTFAATPSTDVSGRFSGSSNTGATNIGVTNGALVTFASPLQGSNGLNISGSGAGSTLKLTEGSGSQVGFSGSGGVNVNGATLFLSGNNNTELGSNAVAVGVNGVLSSNSTKLVTSGATTVNGVITGGSGNVSGDTYGNMHLSATTFNATGAYDWKLNVAPGTAYHSGSTVNSVMTAGALNANSLTNFDTLFSSSLTDTASGFGIKLIPTGVSNLATGTYEFAIANTIAGTFTTSNFSFSGFTLADVADSSLSAANNGGVNSELDGGTGQDLVLTYTVAPSVLPIFSLTTTTPGAAYGSTITNGAGNLQGAFTGPGAGANKLTVTGGSGSYVLQQATGIKDGSGSSNGPGQANIEANGFSPSTDMQVYALDIEVGGVAASTAQLNTLVAEAIADGLPAGMTVSTTAPLQDPFAGNYNLFLDVNPGLASDVFLGWDLSSGNDSHLTGGYTVSAVAVVPEPMSLGVLVLAGVGMLGRRSRREAQV